MNSVNLLGTIGNDVELGKTTEGKEYLRLSLAVRRKKDKTDWFNAVAYGQTAIIISQYFKKGHRIGITGQLFADTTEKDGKKFSSTKIFINDITFIEKKSDTEQNSESTYTPRKTSMTLDELKRDESIKIDDSDLPF